MLFGLVCQPRGPKGEDVKEACPFAGIIQIKFAGISQIDRLCSAHVVYDPRPGESWGRIETMKQNRDGQTPGCVLLKRYLDT